jgi:hypothetical protein
VADPIDEALALVEASLPAFRLILRNAAILHTAYAEVVDTDRERNIVNLWGSTLQAERSVLDLLDGIVATVRERGR